MLIPDPPKGLQRHLSALKVLCTDKGLLINMDKTKVMVFNTIQAWVTRLEQEFFLGEEKVAYTRSYTYLGVTFTALGSPNGKLLVPNFLVDVQPLVLLEDNVHICISKSHELN